MTDTVNTDPAARRPRKMAREPNGGAADQATATAPIVSVPNDHKARRPSKSGLVLSMLRRPEGATIEQLVAATGWLPHTARAMLTGLRKKGHVINKAKRDAVTSYSIKAGSE